MTESSRNDFKSLHDDFNINLEKEKEKMEIVKNFKPLHNDFTLQLEKKKKILNLIHISNPYTRISL